jgi:uncharacterized integral membrane protein (TIGR00697 family)
MINEIVFFIQIFLVSLILIFNSSKEKINFLYQLFAVSLVLINLLVKKEIILFGIHTTTIEPYAILMFWIASTIYYLEGNIGAKRIIYSTFFINSLIIIFLSLFLIYNSSEKTEYEKYYKFVFESSIYSVIISTITFCISYFIERKIFNLLIKKFNNIYSQGLAISIGQLFDTFIFSYLYFQKPILTILQIAIFSYLIKLICILISTIFQKIYKVKVNDIFKKN